MTRAGTGFILAGLAVYFLGSQTRIGWLYLFDAMIWSLVVLSAFSPWQSLKSLRVERRVSPSPSSEWHPELAGPSEGSTVEVRLKVGNQGRLARHFIKVVEDCPLEGPERRPRLFLLPSLQARSEVAFSYTATCYHRGRYTSAPVVLETAAPMGLFVRRRRYHIPLDVTVYPAYHRVEGVPQAREGWADRGGSARSSAASEFYGSREYHYGDPLRYIHWRNTARLGQFVVKEFEGASQGPLAVAFETIHDWGVGRETTLEYSIKMAASLARLCADSGRGISILAGPAPLPSDSLRKAEHIGVRLADGAGWREAMDYLAGLTVGGTASLAELTAALEAGHTLVAIVSARETGLIPSLERLARREGRLMVVLLEGFAPGEQPQEFVSRLGESNLDLLRCSRGNLKAAIDALGPPWLFPNQLPAEAG